MNFQIGFECASTFRKKGHMKSASEAVIVFARDVLDLVELLGITFNDNDASKHLLQSLGFEFVDNQNDELLFRLNLQS